MAELKLTKKLSGLEYLRVTSLRTFEECPFTWAATYLGEAKGEDNEYSKIGTAAHSIMENFLLELWPTSVCANISQTRRLAMSPEDKIIDDEILWKIIPEDEVSKLHEYMDTFSDMFEAGYTLLTLEETLEQNVDGVPIPIRGHSDAKFLSPSGAIVIVDHKTNRTHDTADWWRRQLQQLLYARASK